MIGRGCKSMQRLISASLDGELSPEDELRLQSHLDYCLECRQTRDAYRANRELVRRNLPGNADPPQYVTDEILRKTREISNARGIRRLILGSRLRLTMSVVATIAVLIIASAFFLVQNYRAGISPSIAGFQPRPTQEVDFLRPITITFNKPMNKASVMDNLRIQPSSEMARLISSHYYHWDGNSLIIGAGKHGQTRPLLTASDYVITIMPGAKDANGNPLGGNGWKVSFRTTSDTKFASGTPAVTPSASSTATSITQVQGTKTATEAQRDKGQSPDANGAPTSSGVNQQGTGSAQNQSNSAEKTPTGTTGTHSGTGAGNVDGSSTGNSGTSNLGNGSQGTQTTNSPSNGSNNAPAGSADTSGQSKSGAQTTKSPTATPTATSSVTNTPTAPAVTPTKQATTATTTNTTPTETATPAGSADPTSSSTSTSTTPTTSAAATDGTSTATKTASTEKCQNPTASISGAAFGSVYWAYPDVCNKLGMPSNSGVQVQTSILTFQRGVLIERMDTKKVYILTNVGTGGTYQVVDAPSPSVAGNDGTPAPVDNLWIPGGDLGKVWSDNKLQGQIGYATSKTSDSSTATPVQEFAHGTMIYSDAGFVYVLYPNEDPTKSTWQVYPDTSGHGALLTSTATTPSPTPTVSPTTAP